MSIDQPGATAGATAEAGDERASTIGASDAISRAHRPAIDLAGPYGHPFHPLLVTLPIGAWVSAVVFDVISHSKDPRTFVPAAFYLVIIGIAGALGAAVFGLMDMRAIAPGSKARRIALIHLALNTAVIILFAITLPIRRQYVDHSSSPLFKNHTTDPTPWSAVAISIVALVLLGASGWLGGKLAHRYGVRAADEADQAEGLVPEVR